MNIRAVIVDDEALARRRIHSLLRHEPDISVVEECVDGVAAVVAIQRHRPDLLFIDIQMPEMDGFEVLRRVGLDAVRAVVFVTAYEQFSLQAFEVHALDYLLKPFHRVRFQETLRRVRRRLNDVRELAVARSQLSALLAADAGRHQSGRGLERITIRSVGKVTFVPTSDIDWIEADGNYARLYVGRRVYLHRQTMKTLAEQLDPDVFVRIHHSRIVNVQRVRTIQPWSHGDYVVLLEHGQRLTSSRSYSANLRRALAL